MATKKAKAVLRSENGLEIECMFNPAQLSLSRTANWQSRTGKGQNSPRLQFQAGLSDVLSLKLTLDTTLAGTSVLKHTNELESLMDVDDSLKTSDKQRNSGRPPWVSFHWGDFNSFKAVLTRLQLRFTYFTSSGVPLRAEADLTLKQFEDRAEKPKQNPTSGGGGPATVHQVAQGETLDRIAARYYGESALWRMIADENGIIDPLELRPGVTLVIPSREARVA